MHGSFEAVKSTESSRGMVMRQMAVGEPIGFHSTDGPPLSVVGGQAVSSDGSVSADFLIEEVGASAVLGSHITNAQCGHCGVYLTVGGSAWSIGPSIGVGGGAAAAGSWKNGTCHVAPGDWHSIKLNVTRGVVHGWLDGEQLFAVAPGKEGPGAVDLTAQGWVGIGAGTFGAVQYDRFAMQQ
jgi:hypothetical protein